MLNDSQIVDIWILFKEYLDKKQIELVAEKYIDLLADYGVSDEVLDECLGNDTDLDDGIRYYLDVDFSDEDDDYDDRDY